MLNVLVYTTCGLNMFFHFHYVPAHQINVDILLKEHIDSGITAKIKVDTIVLSSLFNQTARTLSNAHISISLRCF